MKALTVGGAMIDGLDASDPDQAVASGFGPIPKNGVFQSQLVGGVSVSW